MLSSAVLLPPSPNWYGSQLAALQPSISQVAYAGHSSVVVACCHTHSVLRTLCAGPSRVTSLCWSSSAATPHQLVSGHEDGGLRTWDARSGACMRSHKKKGAEVSALVLLSDRQPAVAVVGDAKGNLQLWQYQAGNKPQPMQVALRGKVTQLCALTDPPTTTHQAATSLLSASTPGQPVDATPPGMVAPVLAPGGASLVLAACSDGSVTLIDVEAGMALHCFSAHRGCVHAISVVWAPPSVLPATCLVTTASGEEGTAKVWQLSCATRQHTVGLLATLTAPGARQDAGGGRGYQSSRQRQQPTWLTASLLPPPPPITNLGAGSADGALSYCWIALGLATGEVWLHRVHAVTGRVDAPFKLFGIHNRPVFSVMAMPSPTSPFDALQARAQGSTHSPSALQPIPAATDLPGTSGSIEQQGASPLAVDPTVLDVIHSTGTEAEQQVGAELADPQGGGSGAHGRTGKQASRYRLTLVTLSQDRLLAVTLLHLKLGTSAKPAKAAKAGKGRPTKTPPPEPAEGIPADNGSSVAGSTGATSAPTPASVRSPSPMHGRTPAAGASDVKEEAPHGAQVRGPKPMPVFHVALGPPADRTQRGFGGRGGGRGAAAPAVPADATAAVAAPLEAEVPAPAQTENGSDAAPVVPPAPPAPPAPSMPTPVTPARVQAASSLESGSAGAEEPPNALAWNVSGYESIWKLPGLGGFAHSVDVPLPHSHTDHPAAAPGTAAGPNEALGGPVNITTSWEMVTGCGDRTIRISHFQWPLTCDLVSSKAPDKDVAASSPAHAEVTAAKALANAGAGAEAGIVGRDEGGAAAVTGAELGAVEVGSTPDHAGKASTEWKCSVERAVVVDGCMLWRNLADQVLCVARHPSYARYVAFGCQDGQVGVFDVQTQVPHLYPTRHQGPVLQLCWYAATLPPSAPHPAITPPSATFSTNSDAESTRQATQQQQQEVEVTPDSAPRPALTSDVSLDIAPPSACPPPVGGGVGGGGPGRQQQQQQQGKAGGQQHQQQQHQGKAGGREQQQQHQQQQHGSGGREHHQQQHGGHDSHAAMHAASQSWQLVSCGAEGRLLTWQVPGQHEWGAGTQQGGGGPAAGKGSADRSGRWGAAAPAPAATVNNDLLPHLLPLLPLAGTQPAAPAQPAQHSQPAGTAAQHGACALTVVPREGGDLLVLALSSGLLAVLASAQPQQLHHQRHQQHQQHQRRVAAGELPWVLLWSRQVEGAPPSMLAARFAPGSHDTLSIACASSRSCAAVYTARLPTPPQPAPAAHHTRTPSGSGPTLPPPSAHHARTASGGPLTPPPALPSRNARTPSGSHPIPDINQGSSPSLPGTIISDIPGADMDSMQPFVLQDPESGAVKTVTSMCWLPGMEALALGCAEDATIQIWAAAAVPETENGAQTGAEGGSLAAIDAVMRLQPSSLVPSAQAVVLATLRGHTDHVVSLVARGAEGPAAAAGLVWLFSGSRDQSARGWVLDRAALWQQYRQQRQALLLRQEQQRQQQALQQQQAAEAAAAADELEATSPDAADAGPVHGEPPAATDDAPSSQPANASASVSQAAGDSSLAGASDAKAGEAGLPSILIAAPAKSDITGLPGARPKAAKKPMVLASKQILDPELAASHQGLVLRNAEEAWRQLEALLATPDGQPLDNPERQQEVATSVQAAVAALGDPVVVAASGQTRAPEKLVMVHLWAGNVKAALQVAIDNKLLSADLVSVSASMGRAAWAATSRLYAAQQEAAGQVHVAVMHLLAIGDRPGAAAAYRRAGLLLEAQAIDSPSSLMQSVARPPRAD